MAWGETLGKGLPLGGKKSIDFGTMAGVSFQGRAKVGLFLMG